jgi:predicted TIM-barrel fold metal-dependent hydrolase
MSKLTRRDFLQTIPGLTAVPLLANSARTDLILDLHQHTNYSGRTNQQLVAHQMHHRVTTTVLLPGDGWMLSELGDNASCAAMQADYPNLFSHFACADVAESRMIDVLRGNVNRGAIGIGELKFHVAADSPEMHRVFKLAEELNVPVLIHFEYETYSTGLDRFSAILKAYPAVNFIGHAQTWWGNISAELNPLDLYPKGPVKPGGLIDRLLADFPNIYGDLSAGSGLNALTRDSDFARDFVTRHSGKLIWGSDCACHDGKGAGTKGGYCIAERSLVALRKLVPDETVLHCILYENGVEVLRLKP